MPFSEPAASTKARSSSLEGATRRPLGVHARCTARCSADCCGAAELAGAARFHARGTAAPPPPAPLNE
jgi:hypothetical protein